MPVGSWGPDRARSEGSIDRQQFRALVVASIKLDLRSSRGHNRVGRRLPPMAVAFITYAAMGTLLASAVVMTSDVFVFSLFGLSAAMIMTALLVIMEYSSVVVHPDDFDILAHRPISSKTYYWSKIANLALYVAATASALAMPAAIIGGLKFEPGYVFGPIYFAVALVACLATAALVVLVYSAALKVFDYNRFTRAITYVHSLATLFIVLGYVLLPRFLAEDVTLSSVSRGPWIYAAPPAWYAGAVELGTGIDGGQSALLTLLAAVSAAALIGAAMNTISLEYSRRISELATASEKSVKEVARKRRSFGELGLKLCRSDEERAGYQLMRRYMTRDRKLRARVYPAFGLPLAVYIFGLLTDGLGDPFANPRPDTGGFPAQMLLALYSVFITVFFTTAISQSDHWEASWIFYASPLDDRAGIIVGARKLIIWRYLAPFFVVLFVLLAFPMPVAKAALFVLLTALLAFIAFALLSFASPHLPLSQAIEKARQARQIGLVMLLGLSFALFAAIVELVREIPAAGVYVVAWLLIVAGLCEFAIRRHLKRRLAGEEFAG